MLNYKAERETKALHAGYHSRKFEVDTSSAESDTDERNKKRTYAEVLYSESNYDSSTESDKYKEMNSKKSDESEKAQRKGDRKIPIEWEKAVSITRCYLHDDWEEILDKLAKQIEVKFTYQPFHVEKAIILLQGNQ